MDITLHTKDSWIIFKLSGKLNEISSPDLLSHIDKCIEDKTTQIILNCEHLEFINSPGITSLISLKKKIERSKGCLRLVNLNGFVMELFKMTKLTDIFDIYSSEESAITA